MQAAINFVIALILELFGAMMAFIGLIDVRLSEVMTRQGIGDQMQTVIILVVTVFLVLAALRFVGGLFGWLVLVLLSLLLLHHLIPAMVAAGWVPGLQGHLF